MGLLDRIAIPGLQLPTAGKTAVELRAQWVEETTKQEGQPQLAEPANESSLSSTDTVNPQPSNSTQGA